MISKCFENTIVSNPILFSNKMEQKGILEPFGGTEFFDSLMKYENLGPHYNTLMWFMIPLEPT